MNERSKTYEKDDADNHDAHVHVSNAYLPGSSVWPWRDGFLSCACYRLNHFDLIEPLPGRRIPGNGFFIAQMW